MAVATTCDQCGQEFAARVRSGRPPSRFCSIACRGAGRRELSDRTCPTCTSAFRPRKEAQIYCSRDCAPGSPRAPGSPAGAVVETACLQCQGVFTVKPHERPRKKFCSVACKNESLRLRRDPRQCLECDTQFIPQRAKAVYCSRLCAAAHARAQGRRPWHIGARTVLALSCDECLQLLPPDAFDVLTDGYRRKRCRECVMRLKTPAQRERRRAMSAAADAQTQRTTHPADHRGEQWTGPDLELALREDLTARQVALLIGRTYYAVQTARHKARTDPKWIAVVGAAL